MSREIPVNDDGKLLTEQHFTTVQIGFS